MDIQIKFLDGSTYPLKEVSPSATVGDLKKLIQQKSGDLPARQKLSNENGVKFSNDSSTLSATGLKNGSCVMVLVQDSMPFQVLVTNTNGLISTYDVMPGETVSDFKKKVYNKEKCPVNQQRLYYNDVQLQEGKTLEDYDIGSLSIIQLTLRLRGG